MGTDYPPEKIISILKASRLFNQFDESQLIQLMTFATVEHFKKGFKIIQENKPNQTIYILIKGSVDIFVGEELILKLRRKGDIIGEMSVITKSPTTASVVAATPVILFAIPSQKIYASSQLELRSLWYKLFSDILAQKLSMTNRKVVGFQEASANLDQKKSELLQKTMILQSVLGSMGDGVVVTDGIGGILHANEAFVQMIGNIQIPAQTKNWPDKIGFFKPDCQTLYRVQDLPMTKAEAGILVESEEIYLNNDNLKEGIWLQASSSLLKTDDGKQLAGSVVVFRNYTKKKQEEQALIKAKENAEATAKAKSDFLSIMSHELRTPLNGILGMSDLLKNSSLTSDQESCLDNISHSGHTLLAKIKNILYFNTLESGDVQLKKETLSLKDILDTTIKFHSPIAQKKKVTIVADICKTAEASFMGDPEKIIIIINNLMDNAVKYTNKGTIHISVSEKKQKKTSVMFLIKIKDTGIGLSQEHVQKLFQPFFQADTSYSRQFEGTGIGLAVAQKSVEVMGGKLQAQSIFGEGSCFSFTLLLSKLDKKIDKQKLTTPTMDIKSLINKDYATHHPLNILVAEDNKVNQLLIKKVLANLGYQVHISENGLQAFEACKYKAFDLILMDIQMPVMDGIEATKKILNEPSQKQFPAIVALTANTAEGVKEDCLSAGMINYMTKPLNVETLVTILEQLPMKKKSSL